MHLRSWKATMNLLGVPDKACCCFLACFFACTFSPKKLAVHYTTPTGENEQYPVLYPALKQTSANLDEFRDSHLIFQKTMSGNLSSWC